jgi:hypothetical protein
MLGLARRELEAMRTSWCAEGHRCELLVIPGNHDVGIWGNLAVWPWSGKFGIVFSDRHRGLFDRLPCYIEYMRRPWWARWSSRLGWTLHFAFARATFRLRRPPPAACVTELAEGALCFARFDSNRQLVLASGYISAAEISQVSGELLQRRLPRRDGRLLNLVPRICLVHHHVVAIPYASATESLTEFEPFLTLRNAGTLLRALCNWDFDMVLHGHKHLLNFVRLTFDSADQPRSEIAVLAAGSATKRQTVSGQNSFNLIKVYPSGSITYRAVRYGQGFSSELESPWGSGFQRLLPLDELKLRAHGRARAGQEISCESLEYRYHVNESGSARCERQVRGLRGLREEQLRQRYMEFSVGFGAVPSRTVRLNSESELAGHVLRESTNVNACRVRVQVQLTGQRLAADVGSDFGLIWRTVNSFATTAWECLAMGQSDERDWLAIVVRTPTKRLKIAIDLPASFRNPSPQVLVYRCRDYPLVKVNAQGDVECGASTVWDIDPDLTELEKAKVRMVGHSCELDVGYPIVGHRYELRWRVETEVAATTALRRGLAQQLRRTLLKLLQDDNPKAAPLARLANEMLRKVTHQLIRPLVGSTLSLDEQLDCTLFVYNDEAKGLDLIAEGRTQDAGPLIVRHIPLNAGVSGAAFKHRGVSLYICPSCADADGEIVDVYYPDEAKVEHRPDYAALLAIPLSLSDLDFVEAPASSLTTEPPDVQTPDAPEEFIGVFTIASTARDNRLMSLTGIGESQSKTLEKHELVSALWSIAAQYLEGLGDAVRKAATAG